MGLKKILQSAPIPYRTISQRLATGLLGGLYAGYNPYLITPPRTYPEALVSGLGCAAFWVTREPLSDSTTVINMILWEDQIYYPSWNLVLQRYDTVSGAALSSTDVGPESLTPITNLGPISVAWTRFVVAAFDGTLWRNQLNTELTQVDPATFAVIRGPFFASLYTGLSVGFGAFVVDPINNLLMVSAYGAPATISVYPLSGGVALRTFNLSGPAIQMCPVNTTKFYVLTEQGVLNLCDQELGQVISSVLLPAEAFTGTSKVNITWDPVRNMLLVFSQVPDNADGSSASIIRGYYPVPQPTRLTVPFPLRPLRRYATVPYATRLVGDLGRPIAGGVINANIVSTSTDPTPGAALMLPNAASNANGYATFSIEGLLESTVDLSVSTTL